MAEVKLSNVGKIYVTKDRGVVPAVSDFSLEIRDHEFVVLTGPTECGKTTLLRLITGLEEPDMGEIRVGGVKPGGRKNAVRTGMVFRSGSLYPHFTVYRNLAFPLKHLPLTKEEKDRKIRETARLFQIEDILSLRPKALNREQRMRAAAARAIVSDPDVVVMDEPLLMLEDQARERLRTELIRFRNERRLTVILALSDLSEAMALGDRVVFMESGRIQSVRTPEEILQEGRL